MKKQKIQLNIKIFFNNLIILILFIYAFHYLSGIVTNIYYINEIENNNPYNLKINLTEINQEYGIDFENYKYEIPTTKIIIILSLILILILNFLYYFFKYSENLLRR